MTEPAPFYSDVAAGPDPDICAWATASDGVRLRLGLWKGGRAGTVLLYPGRTEYLEKYAGAAAAFAAHDLCMTAIDWRGQGLADRLVEPRYLGHVGEIGDYQLDAEPLLALARAEGLPEPFYVIGHSMGGAIALRAIYEGLPVAAAGFTAPMWGVSMAPHLRPVAWALSWAADLVGQGARLTPGTSPVNYAAEAPFEGNMLTRDPEMFETLRRQVTTHPDLALGGPSLHWLRQSMMECRRLMARPAPDLPTLTFLGANERIVETAPIKARMASWPKGELRIVPDAEHEVMMETPDCRAQVFDGFAAFFKAHGVA
ncbi:Lysophospholipase L2 [Candidatus Rhodobacter oscarellae]|uniref:Lysophospholipase L2 n=1 Tax=Candidatus Rhodobacter oscarellae TaxID=1675527 RepID=A0A0J9E5N7_9RHOB|nr:alpha/beta hydrolase [Candidatus Rhodobacter lobularis]KMW58070.1 Lysophospholipase L2 [Candidatus Rhodobacter lobularis]